MSEHPLILQGQGWATSPAEIAQDLPGVASGGLLGSGCESDPEGPSCGRCPPKAAAQGPAVTRSTTGSAMTGEASCLLLHSGAPAQPTCLADPLPGLGAIQSSEPSPLGSPRHTWAPRGSLTTVHLQDSVSHGCKHAFPVQDVGVPELQGEGEGTLGKMGWEKLPE